MFYAYHNAYGNGTRNSYGQRLGTLHAFDTKRERDEWVEADRFDGNWHREAIDCREARAEVVCSFNASDADPELIPFLSTPELIGVLTEPRYLIEETKGTRQYNTDITLHC